MSIQPADFVLSVSLHYLDSFNRALTNQWNDSATVHAAVPYDAQIARIDEKFTILADRCTQMESSFDVDKTLAIVFEMNIWWLENTFIIAQERLDAAQKGLAPYPTDLDLSLRTIEVLQQAIEKALDGASASFSSFDEQLEKIALQKGSFTDLETKAPAGCDTTTSVFPILVHNAIRSLNRTEHLMAVLQHDRKFTNTCLRISNSISELETVLRSFTPDSSLTRLTDYNNHLTALSRELDSLPSIAAECHAELIQGQTEAIAFLAYKISLLKQEITEKQRLAASFITRRPTISLVSG